MVRALGILALLVLSGCGAGLMPSASTTTANPAWQHYFKVAYDVEPQGESRRISGYLYNEYGVAMRNVRLLIQALNGENVVRQHLTHVPGGVPGFGRSYFAFGGLPPAETYRVTVWSFDRLESPSGGGVFP